jgi:hypothetical protein
MNRRKEGWKILTLGLLSARLRIAAGVRGGRTVTDPPDSVGMENLEKSRI